MGSGDVCVMWLVVVYGRVLERNHAGGLAKWNE